MSLKNTSNEPKPLAPAVLITSVDELQYGDLVVARPRSWVNRAKIPFRHRHGSVPDINRRRYGRTLRHPKTHGQLKLAAACAVSILGDDILDEAFDNRRVCQLHRIPNAYDDIPLFYERSWKSHRKTQWKTF